MGSPSPRARAHARSVAIDFDGVIHSYGQGYGDGTAKGEPVEGAFEAINELLEVMHVFILSCRPPELIAAWLEKHNAPFAYQVIEETPELRKNPFWDEDRIVGITQVKLGAAYYIDDRAVRFDEGKPGEWRDTLSFIWNNERDHD